MIWSIRLVFFQLNFHLQLHFHYENKRCCYFYLTPMHLIWSSLLYNLYTFKALVHGSLHYHIMPCQSGSTFAKFLFIALGHHLVELPVTKNNSLKSSKSNTNEKIFCFTFKLRFWLLYWDINTCVLDHQKR